MRRFNLPSALALVAFTFVLLAPVVGAQTSVNVSNLSQTKAFDSASLTFFSTRHATAFTTGGTRSDSYTLNSVIVDIVSGGIGQIIVSIHSPNGINPGTQVGSNLTGTIDSDAGATTYTASGITLTGGTTYFVQLRAASAATRIVAEMTASDAQTGTSGWSIADGSRYSNNSGSSWGIVFGGNNSLLMAVNATAITRSDPGDGDGSAPGRGSGTTRDTGESAPVICEQQLAGDGTVYGTWNRECPSLARSNTYAHYYAFTLESQSNVTISLESAADTYVYLRSGDRSGPQIADDDDGGNGYNSLLRTTLAAGTYAIEATTFRDETTGTYALRVAGLGRRAPTDQPFECGERLAGDGAVLGIWTADCASVARDGSYARYYVFALDERSPTTITLSSSVDAFLYLRKGGAKESPVLASDDDGGGGSNARISQTLDPGTYVIEATTYYWGQTGSFTLSLADTGDAADPEGGADGSSGVDGTADDGRPPDAPIAFATPEDWGITLFWHAVTGATGYEYQYVYADDDWDSDWVQQRSVGADILSVALRDEIGADPYNLRVRAVKVTGGERLVSDWSETVTAESN